MGEHAQPVFHRAEYAAAYPSLGEVVACGDLPVHRRTVGDTGLSDGALPWPYVWLDEDGITRLREQYHDLITLTGVLAPSVDPPIRSNEVRPFKDHYVFDPQATALTLSHKSRANLRRGERRWVPARADSDGAWLAVSTLYRSLVERRGLGGTPFDLPAAHFDTLRSIPGVTLIGVRDEQGDWGSMTIAAEGPSGTHLLHIVNSDAGLRGHASYVLMQHLVDEHSRRGRCLYLGGAPQRDTDGGVARFKRRWSNLTMPSWLFAAVLRPDVYAELTRGLAPTDYFPAYRSAWS